MNQLLKAEFLRLVSRRLTWILLALSAILAAVISLVFLSSARPHDPLEQIEAQRIYETELAWCEETGECDEAWVAQMEPEDFYRYVHSYEDYITASTSGGFLVGIAVVVLAASLVGSEFTSGSVSTQLTFTPRRMPVMAAKVAAATAGAVGLMVAYLLSVLVVGTIAFMMLRSAAEVVAGPVLPLFLGRVVVATFFVALLTSLLSVGLGSSVTPVAAGTVLLVASFLYQTVSYGTGGEWLLKLLPTVHLESLITGDFVTYLWHENRPSELITITYVDSLVYAVVLVGIVGFLSGLAFKRRDLVK